MLNPDDTTIEQSGLVVDSRFRTRKSIVSDLQQSGVVRSIVEAKSVNDGLEALKREEFLACFLGPSLSESIASDFIEQGRKVSRSKACAFIAVLEEGAPSEEGFQRVRIDGTIKRPYGEQTFAHVVQRAITDAQERHQRQSKEAVKNTLETLRLGPKGLTEVIEQGEKAPQQHLYTASFSLRAVSRDIVYGRLRLKKDGTPTLATRDAIRLALEKAFPPEQKPYEIGTANQEFITILLDWFSDRVQLSQEKAEERLHQAFRSLKTN